MSSRESRRFRVKVVMPHGPDAHYFYASTLEEAEGMRARLGDEIPAAIGHRCFIYVETSFGHIRVA